jgi:hypothetical protein
MQQMSEGWRRQLWRAEAMANRFIGRQKFKCDVCGLRFSGKVASDGKIYASSRGADDDGPVRAAICTECEEHARRQRLAAQLGKAFAALHRGRR